MKIRVLFLALFAVIVLPTASFAMAHSYGVAENLAAFGVPMSIGLKIGIIVDNLMHFLEHIVLTTQVFMQDPLSALMVLDGIGEACFSLVPPASHAFFATGISALVTTLVTYAVSALAILAMFSRLARMVKVTTRQHTPSFG